MRLIFLSWAYPPMEFPRAIQVERLARHLGRPVEIVCAGSGDEAADGIAVHRLPDPPRHGRVARLGTLLAVPDQQRRWAMRAADVVAAMQPAADDVLVTFGQPMSDHLAGLKVTKRFGNRWIAHLSDPWADNPFERRPFARALNRRFERKVVAAATRVLVTSAETRDLVMRKYPRAPGAKAQVLPHAFEPALYPPRAPAHGPFVIRYLGSLYGPRGPQHFLDGLVLLARSDADLAGQIRVEFIGEIAPRHRIAVPQVKFLPSVPYHRSLALMREADLLLHIDAPAERSVFLASKLVDYVGARRPILGVTPSGTAARLIAELGGWTADPLAPEAVAASLLAALDHLRATRDADWGEARVRERYEAARVARQFRDLLADGARE